MKQKTLIRNKLYGIGLIFLGALSVPIEWDATFFLFTLAAGTGLLFYKENQTEEVDGSVDGSDYIWSGVDLDQLSGCSGH